MSPMYRLDVTRVIFDMAGVLLDCRGVCHVLIFFFFATTSVKKNKKIKTATKLGH